MSRRRLTAIAGISLSVGALAVGWVVWDLGHGAALKVVVFAGLLSIPGGIARRALLGPHSESLPVGALADAVWSMAVLVGIGSVAAVTGNFRVVTLGVGLVGVTVLLGAMWQRRSSVRVDLTRIGASAAGLLAVCVLGLVFYKLRPYIGDRIFLGQMETAVQLFSLGEIPNELPAFGADVAFPRHYLFYDFVIGAGALLGRVDSYTELIMISTILRTVVFALFVLSWAVVGVRFVGRIHRDKSKYVGSALPPLLLLNITLWNKYREALAEALAIGLIGVALGFLVASSNAVGSSRKSLLITASLSLGLIPGIHLPAFVAGVILVSAWMVVESLRTHGVNLRHVMIVLAGPVLGLILFELVGGGVVSSLVGGAASTLVSPEDSLRAVGMFVGDPHSQMTAIEFLRTRLSIDTVLVVAASLPVVAVLIALGIVGVIRRRDWPLALWVLISTGCTAAYVAVPFLAEVEGVSPWNAIVRNVFYIWFPIAIGILTGVGLLFGGGRHLRGRSSPLRGVGAVAAAWLASVGALVIANPPEAMAAHWLNAPTMSEPGHEALRWSAANLPADALVMTSEVTYGTHLIVERELLTEGKGTLESNNVTKVAIETLSQAAEFFLPVHNPRILSRVDYIITYAEGIHGVGNFGGIPILRELETRVRDVGPNLDQLPYLELIYSDRGVRIFKVLQEGLPSVGSGPSCGADVCVVYDPAEENDCPPLNISASPDLCVTLHGQQPEALIDTLGE